MGNFIGVSSSLSCCAYGLIENLDNDRFLGSYQRPTMGMEQTRLTDDIDSTSCHPYVVTVTDPVLQSLGTV
jgi:hypothetical protein